MIDTTTFYRELTRAGLGFFTGVPDSLLKELCACITAESGDGRHAIAANEGAAVALATGHYLATGEPGMVYMQNSGLGNAVNPLLSLADEKVYSIPMLLVIGWRGEPGVKDEPQHVKQGEVTLGMLDAMDIPHAILPDDTGEAVSVLQQMVSKARERSSPAAIVVRKDTFTGCAPKPAVCDSPELTLKRERALQVILEETCSSDVIVSTTGMISREIFEYREKTNQGHARDFLTVGSMGHCSQIALGIAQAKQGRQVVCIDGDGAAIMHMGSLAINGQYRGGNLIHVVINNGRHDSVGGQPTAGFDIDLPGIALACGYGDAASVHSDDDIRQAMRRLSDTLTPGKPPVLLEVKVLPGARSDLGRPTSAPVQNKEAFMTHLDAG